jgi:Uroporphyrinogen decarboxylase (URO-D)
MKERLLAPFRGIAPDKPAWVADLSYWYAAAEGCGRLSCEYQGREGYKKLHEDLGVGYYYDYESRLFESEFDGVDFSERQMGKERNRRWRTSKGSLTEHWRFLDSAACWARDKYPVSSECELPILLEICSRMRFAPAHSVYKEIEEWVGESGVPLAPVPRSPLPGLLTDWCGVERTVYFLMDNVGTMRRIMECIDAANDAAFAIVASAPCELVHFCDNLDSSASTPYFEQFMREYYERRVRQLHDAGKHAVVHLDGRVRGLLPLLASCGFDGVESITPAPLGDVAVEELRAVAANPRTILWGGIPGAMFSQPWTKAQICDHTKRLLESLAGENRLIVGSADQIPPNGNLDYCAAISETIEKWPNAVS